MFVNQRTWPQRTLSRSATPPLRSRPRRNRRKRRVASVFLPEPSEEPAPEHLLHHKPIVWKLMYSYFGVCVCVCEQLKGSTGRTGVQRTVWSAELSSGAVSVGSSACFCSDQARLCLLKPIPRSPPTPRTQESQSGEGAGPTASFSVESMTEVVSCPLGSLKQPQ